MRPNKGNGRSRPHMERSWWVGEHAPDDPAAHVPTDELSPRYLTYLATARPHLWRRLQVLHCVEHGVDTVQDIQAALEKADPDQGCSRHAARETVRALREKGLIVVTERDVETGQCVLALSPGVRALRPRRGIEAGGGAP